MSVLGSEPRAEGEDSLETRDFLILPLELVTRRVPVSDAFIRFIHDRQTYKLTYKTKAEAEEYGANLRVYCRCTRH